MNNDNQRAKKNRLPLFNSQNQPLYVSDKEGRCKTVFCFKQGKAIFSNNRNKEMIKHSL